MRPPFLGLAPLLLACAVATAQQTPATSSATGVDPQTAAASQTSTSESMRGDEKGTDRPSKEQLKADARAAKEAEKQKKREAEDAKYLKLQDDEIAVAAFDDNGNPIKLPPCAPKDKACQEKRHELLKEKRVDLNVQNGTLSIDGLIARMRLNYQIPSFLYLYISLPGYGTIVVSPVHFPYSTEVKDALNGKNLTFGTSDGHFIELAGEKPLSGHSKRSIFYAVDRNFQQPGRYPTIGYGTVSKAPYVWPAAAPLTEDQKRRIATERSLPKGMDGQTVAANPSAPSKPAQATTDVSANANPSVPGSR